MYRHLNDNVSVITYIYKYIGGLVFVIKHKNLVAVAPLCTARMQVFAGTEGKRKLQGMKKIGSNIFFFVICLFFQQCTAVLRIHNLQSLNRTKKKIKKSVTILTIHYLQ